MIPSQDRERTVGIFMILARTRVCTKVLLLPRCLEVCLPRHDAARDAECVFLRAQLRDNLKEAL